MGLLKDDFSDKKPPSSESVLLDAAALRRSRMDDIFAKVLPPGDDGSVMVSSSSPSTWRQPKTLLRPSEQAALAKQALDENATPVTLQYLPSRTRGESAATPFSLEMATPSAGGRPPSSLEMAVCSLESAFTEPIDDSYLPASAAATPGRAPAAALSEYERSQNRLENELEQMLLQISAKKDSALREREALQTPRRDATRV
jgi:hypothetical protein